MASEQICDRATMFKAAVKQQPPSPTPSPKVPPAKAASMWAVKRGDDVLYQCMWDECGEKLVWQACEEADDLLLQHIDSHIDDQPGSSHGRRVCKVRGCEIVVDSVDELGRHLKMHLFHAIKQLKGLTVISAHSPEIDSCNFLQTSRIVYQGEALTCEWDACTSSFLDINDYFQHLGDHIDNLDTDDRDDDYCYACKWQGCSVAARSKATLRTHVQHHSGDKICACPFCGAFFANNTKLLDHVNRRQEGDYACFFCQKSFKTKRLLRSHCQRHVRNYKCELCSMALDSESDLRRHVASVHAKVRNHPCDLCAKSFSQRSDLTKHQLRAHSGNSPLFPCPECDKTFKWEKQLRHHSRIHDENYNETPYTCHLCQQRYRRGSALSKHLRVNHALKVPDGFSRFQYKRCADGLIRLQTRRCLGKGLLTLSADGMDEE